MDAPLYPPAVGFVPPTRVPRVLDTHHTSIADLKANPQAWAIVLKEAPGIDMMLGNAMLKPHFGNFSFGNLVQFGAVKPEALVAMDAQLRALGPVL